MKASDIPEIELLRAIRRAALNPRCRFEGYPPSKDDYAMRWDVEAQTSMYPYKVVIVKLNKMMRKGLIEGCTCGCRGDFEITPSGEELLMSKSNDQ